MSDTPHSPTPAERRLTAGELAASIREGTDARDWRFQNDATPVFPPPPLDPFVHMPAVQDLTAAPIPEHFPGLRGKLVRVARRALRGLLKPWTQRQTDFNRLTAHLMHHLAAKQAERTDETVAKLTERMDELTRRWFEVSRRLDEQTARNGTSR